MIFILLPCWADTVLLTLAWAGSKRIGVFEPMNMTVGADSEEDLSG